MKMVHVRFNLVVSVLLASKKLNESCSVLTATKPNHLAKRGAAED